jgi:hypothetical protein
MPGETDPRLYIGCCGAYCKPCKALKEGACQGCKLGYAGGERDISRSKCKIKVCCYRDKKLMTCADCPGLDTCPTANEFYAKNGQKYKKYRQAVEFIRNYGYERFADVAAGWNNAYGRYDKN